MKFLCITIRWFDDRYHGLLGRDGPPEWPPSPYRLFQAIVAGTARSGLVEKLRPHLEWFESLAPPVILAPHSRPGQIITRFVPNNDGDKVPDRQKRLAAKTSRPTLMLGAAEVHYLWRLHPDEAHAQGVIEAAHCLTCMGWGIDMACADGRVIDQAEAEKLNGTRWLPKQGVLRDDGLLRVPVIGSLADLGRSHQSALDRIEHGKPLKAAVKPTVFDSIFYTSTERPLGRPYALFVLRKPDGDFFRYAHAKLIHTAGMVRHAAIEAVDVRDGKKGFPPPGLPDSEAWVDTCIAGHRNGNADHRQFSYLPLPSIGHEHADAMVRRVAIVAPFAEEPHLRHLAEQLDGEQLMPEDGSVGPLLERLRQPDGATRAYFGVAKNWATVTPIVLPGHDDHKPAKTRKLLLAALQQSGIEQPCEFTWGAVPHFNDCLAAYSRDRQGRPIGYFRPSHLRGLTAVHVRLRFTNPVAGPIIIGAGRHYGLGLLAAVGDDGNAR